MSEGKTDVAKRTFVFSCLLLAFSYGVAVGMYELFPHRIIKAGADSVQQVWAERATLLGLRPDEFLIRPARHDGDGVTRFIEDRAAPGLTLVTGFFGDTNELRLIRLDGAIVQRWPVRYSDVFPTPTHVAPDEQIPATDWNTDIQGALALPDGSVVFNFEYTGMVKLDRCGVVEWTLPRMTHHSIELAQDGGFWVPGRRYVEGVSDFPPLEAPYSEDLVLKVSAEGEVLTEMSVPKLLLESSLLPLWLANRLFSLSGSDYHRELVHLNDIEELSDELATEFPQFGAGDLLLSLRLMNLILVIDAGSGRVKWHQTGPWIRQHDPDFLPDGTISVFNNNSDDTESGTIFGGSSIVRVDPSSGAVTVRYGAALDQHMYTRYRGKHQTLENGNILVTETQAGRIFEIDDRGDIVWEFMNRFDEDEVASVTQADRYPEDYFTVEDWACGSEAEAQLEDTS